MMKQKKVSPSVDIYHVAYPSPQAFIHGTCSMFKYLTNNFHINVSGILPCRIPHNNRVHAFVLTLRPLNSQDAMSPCTLYMDTSTCICQDLKNQSQFVFLPISFFQCKTPARVKSQDPTLSSNFWTKQRSNKMQNLRPDADEVLKIIM